MLGLAIDNGFDPVTKEPRAHTMEAIALLQEVTAKTTRRSARTTT